MRLSGWKYLACMLSRRPDSDTVKSGQLLSRSVWYVCSKLLMMAFFNSGWEQALVCSRYSTDHSVNWWATNVLSGGHLNCWLWLRSQSCVANVRAWPETSTFQERANTGGARISNPTGAFWRIGRFSHHRYWPQFTVLASFVTT